MFGNDGQTLRSLHIAEAYSAYRLAVSRREPHEKVMELLRAWLALDDDGSADFLALQ